ncbi:sigma factor [Streptomyces sp. G1]|uniref:sigma factor n=1 Tax=Streptomyces sp. G1 TaxID=361572 RepID=UPI00202E4417|nr:hypothetical protein [Streptomyces sp. G1]
MTRICRSITRDDAADAAQEALLAIYRGLNQLREPVASYGWVRAVTVREAVRTAKKRCGEEHTCGQVESHQQTNPWTRYTSPTSWTASPSRTARS